MIVNENEIICLSPHDQQWMLSTGRGYFDQQKTYGEMSLNSNHAATRVFIMSFLGNTAVGKSFIAQHLFSNDERRPKTIPIENLHGSTTRNVECFESKHTIDGEAKTLVLDFEGLDGTDESVTPPVEIRNSSSSDRREKRCTAMAKYFTKLAYILSNIMVLVTKNEIFSRDYLRHCQNLVQSANTGVDQVTHRPILLIIQNCCSLKQSMVIDEVTREFKTNQQEWIEQNGTYFSDIFCLRLPNTEHPLGEEAFRQQIDVLKQKCTEIYRSQEEHLITHQHWLKLVRRVLPKVSNGESVPINILLAKITDIGENYQSIANKLFLYLYSKNGVHSPKWFRYCREVAIRMLSRSVAITLLEQNHNQLPLNRDQCETELRKLWNSLNEFKPCEQPYLNDPIKLEYDAPIICYQDQGSHPSHRISGRDRMRIDWVLYFRSIVWTGPFISNERNELCNEQIHDFVVKTNMYAQNLRKDKQFKYTSLIQLLNEFSLDRNCRAFYGELCACCLEKRKYTEIGRKIRMAFGFIPKFCKLCSNEMTLISLMPNDGSSPSAAENILSQNITTTASYSAVANDECVICQVPENDYAIVPCGHKGFCEACAGRIRNNYMLCPICRGAFTSIIRTYRS